MKRSLIATLALAVLAAGSVAAYFFIRKRAELQLTLVPGKSIWEHADKMAAGGFGTRDEILALAADPSFARGELGDLVGPDRSARPDNVAPTYVEGFVAPDTYGFELDTSAADVLRRTFRQFKKVWGELTAKHADRYRELHARFSDLELVTIASLIEEETADYQESKRIAGVFYNRLAKGMRLETDPTLMYRPDRVGKKPSPTERKDASNPYNTYAIAGLPPGPICSPSKRSLEAVLAPEDHDYLFFVARRDGTGQHAFAATLEEHEANVDRYLRKPAKP